MLRRQKTRVAAGVAVAAALVSLALAGLAFGDLVNTDLTGDATGGSPDITQVTATNDASGLITIRITTVAPITSTSLVGVDLDTDGNPATGLNGTEYSLLGDTTGFGLLKWDGSNFVDAPAPSMGMSISGNVVEFRINRADIGNVTRFGFVAFTVNFDAADKYLGEDDAPDGGESLYTLTLPQCGNGIDDDGDGRIDAKDFGCSSQLDNNESDDVVTLRAGAPIIVPAKARAGKLVIVGVPLIRVETGKAITSGTVKCAAKAGTKALPGRGQIIPGGAACAFKVPLKAKGKTVRGTVTVSFLGKTKVVKFSFKAN